MKKLFVLFVGLLAIAAMQSCSRHTFGTSTNFSSSYQRNVTKEAEHHNVPLTLAIIKKYGLTKDAHLKKLQYFLEGEILLSVEIPDSHSVIEGGYLDVGKKLIPLEVRIPNGTPGIYVDAQGDGGSLTGLAVRFEQEGTGRFLWFAPSKMHDGKFSLAYKPANNRFEVFYDGRMHVASVISVNAFLSIDIKETLKIDPQKRVATGVPLGASTE